MRILIIACMLLVPLAVTAQSDGIPDEVLLALEASGEMTAPVALVAQIADDLATCRTFVPRLDDIHVRPTWIPGEVIVGLTEAAWADYVAGQHDGINALNAAYGMVERSRLDFIEAVTFESETLWHADLLAALYEPLEGVRYAEPNHLVGDGSDITVIGDRKYRFREAWGDCLAGCMYSHYWEFDLSGGGAVLVAEGGTTPIAESSWGAIKFLYR